MKFKRKTFFIALTLIFSSAAQASSLSCMDSEETRNSCKSFITGFLQGALLTDEAIITTIHQNANESSFKDRALRTRLGNDKTPPTLLAGFCLPSEHSVSEIAAKTLEHVSNSEPNSDQLAIDVYNTLKNKYACKE